MNQPPEDKATARVIDNLDYFRLNYVLSLSFTIFFTSVIKPNFLLIALPILIAVACFFGLVYEDPIPIGDGQYLNIKGLSRIYAITAILIIIVTSGATFFLLLLMNLAIILIHAYLKERGPIRKIKSLTRDLQSSNNPILDRIFEVIEICLGVNDSTEIYNGRRLAMLPKQPATAAATVTAVDESRRAVEQAQVDVRQLDSQLQTARGEIDELLETRQLTNDVWKMIQEKTEEAQKAINSRKK